MYASPLTRTGQYRVKRVIETTVTGPVTREPKDLRELRDILDPNTRMPLPIRIQGAGSACTGCNVSETGTTVRMTRLDRIINVDSYNHTATVQAGVLVADLVKELAEYGLELAGGYDLAGRTVGGAVSAPCFGPSIGNSGTYFASSVTGLKMIRADGHMLKVDSSQKNLLGSFRSSLGMLGVIHEVTLKVRPIRTFKASHRRVTIDKFASIVDALANADVGIKFYLMPYRDRVYLDIRRYEADPGNTYAAPWKLKDWGESTVLPHIFASLNRVVPMQSMRYKLIDSISEATQGLVNSKFVNAGSNAASLTDPRGKRTVRRSFYSTWCFPAANFSMVVRAYRDFCQQIYANSGFRCDMPAVGYRLGRDSSSLLSPSFDEPMIALRAATTQEKGWDDFVIDFAEFAEKWGGLPLISQSRAMRAEHVIQSYNKRLDFFRHMRRKVDPDNRLLSPFMAQFMQ
ncbi:MAG: FAD-binding oxidoreductase [Woeseiaceae bacterium]|jgi:FAD/FMN-containing dehydrogenase